MLTHEFVPGAPQELVSWCLRQGARHVSLISHPLYRTPGEVSTFRRWQDGRLVRRLSGPAEPRYDLFRYLLHALLNVIWLASLARKGTWIVAADPLNTLSAFPYRLLTRAPLIMYSIDFTPRGRLSSPLLGRFYLFLDLLAVRAGDACWNLSPRMAEGRRRLGLGGSSLRKQVTVPIGTSPPCRRVRARAFHSARIGFIGHITAGKGCDLLLRAIARVLGKLHQTRATIIGDGPGLPGLKSLAAELGIANAIEFTGLIQDRARWEPLLARCTVAAAPLEHDTVSSAYYADPTKLKDYLNLGLPVVLTGIAVTAATIASEGAGSVVPYDEDAFADALAAYLTDSEYWLAAHRAALRLADRWRWDSIFPQAFRDTRAVLGTPRDA